MPLPIQLSHAITQKLAEVRKNGKLSYLRPDGKAQVTVEYINDKPARVETIVVSTQHNPAIDGEEDNTKIQARIEKDLRQFVLDEVFSQFSIKPDEATKYFINPSGRFVIGGPQGDAGLTGRKIIVDTYGGYSRHGGGAFSGKDPTKVDRSAAYAARHVAKNIVAAKLATKCEVQIGYAIGVARPMSVNINTFGTSTLTDTELANLVAELFDLRPAAIIQNFDLQNLPKKRQGVFYKKIAAYGHFGRKTLDLPWEQLDKADALRQAAQAVKPSLTASV
jgi:S-adenosylmethionine synthetase